MSKSNHVVYVGSVRLASGEWLYYFCHTCGGSKTTIYANRHADDGTWGAVVDKFDREHPHTEVREVSCC